TKNVTRGMKRKIEEDSGRTIPQVYQAERAIFVRSIWWRGGKITLFSVRSTLYRTRLETLSVLPKSVEQLQIPASMAVTINQQQFLIYHMNNIVVYASPTGLQMLQQNSHWNADGTFKTAP
ncbi:unnamed protein product, partial [Didymodactylos carnosus]